MTQTNDTTAHDDLKLVLQFASTLADKHMLRLIGVLTHGEQPVDALATQLKLKPADVSRQLAQLIELGIVSQHDRGGERVYRFALSGLKPFNQAVGRVSKQTFANTQTSTVTLSDEESDDAWKRKVLQTAFVGEQLREIPSSHKRLLVVLRWLAQRFDENATYPERAVNEILKRHHPDFATLRRELVDHGFMYRQDGIYWRLPLPALSERLLEAS